MPSALSPHGLSTQALLARSTLVSQGAEAKVYLGVLHPPLATSDSSSLSCSEISVFLKHRFSKKYRHTTLDLTLNRSRIGAEARALAKCARVGVIVPGVRFVDPAEGVLGLEWIDGHSVRALLQGEPEDEADDDMLEDSTTEPATHDLSIYNATADEVMALVGVQLAKMHQGDVIHGDLTTSNMMLRQNRSLPGEPTELVLIDFGLAYTSTLVEDKAVDLYVLERALGATHPDGGRHMEQILLSYAYGLGDKEWCKVETRLKDVRMRGRKRSMVG